MIVLFFVIFLTKVSVFATTVIRNISAKHVGQKIMALKHIRRQTVVELEV